MSLTSHPWMLSLIGGSLGVTLSLLAARRLAPRGWMDHPDERHQHGRPTPRTGGIALFTGFLILRLLGVSTFHLDPLQWAGLLVMVILGAWDDRAALTARTKALVGLAVACLLAWEQSHQIGMMVAPVRFAGFPVPAPLVFPLLVAWFWGVPQAFNLADGLNGFALGLAGLFLVASGHGPLAHPVLWGLLISAFLMNFPKAFHFLGDAGSLGLGTLVSIVVMDSAVRTDSSVALWICAYLVVDCTSVVVSRLLRHRPLGQGDRSHLHHLLLDACSGRAWMATPLLLLLSLLPQLHIWEGGTLLDESGLLILMGLGGFAVVRSTRQRVGPQAVGTFPKLQAKAVEPTPLRPWDAERTSA